MTMVADSAAVERIFAAMRELVPGLPVAIGPAAPGTIVPGADNSAALGQLVAGVRQAHPQAGPLFWAVRSWSLLEWQPTALAVLGVHVARAVPRIDAVALSLGDGASFGLSLPSSDVDRGPVPALIELAGARLRALAERLIDELDATMPLKRNLARRLLADRVLGGLAHLGDRGWSAEDVLVLSEAWLAALGLKGASRLVPLTLTSGRRQPVLDRRSCCLEYRVADGVCCMTCPRLQPAEREARIRRHWESSEACHASA